MILPKDRDKISGIIFYQTRQGFGENDDPSSIHLNMDPNAKHPAPPSLYKVFEGKVEYHL
jgi:hypothetical protein